ncbi:MAG: DUF1573 domain-containing protein [Verrucomicrobiota bacterium]
MRKIPVFLLLTLSLTSADGLEWEQTDLTLPCGIGEQELVAVFPFQNPSEKTITVSSIQSSCGCTVAELEKNVYAPGESGELRAVFEIGDRLGPQRKMLRVTTSNGEESRIQTLTFSTNVPVMGSIHPKLLVWRSGDGVEEKIFTVTASEGVEWILETPPENFPFVWKELEREAESSEARFSVRPAEKPMGPSKAELLFMFTVEGSDLVRRQKVFLVTR